MTDVLVADTRADEEPTGIDPAVRRALPELAARVQRRHPGASSELVQRCLHSAMQQFRDARVRVYLPILIERAASASLRDELS